MSKYSNTVEYNIRTTLDTSGIAKLKAELTGVESKLRAMGGQELLPHAKIQSAIKDIQRLQTALTKAFNPKLGMLNSNLFLTEVTKGGRSLAQIYDSMALAGTQGTKAFNSMYGQIAKIDTGLRSVSKTTDKIFNTMGNTFRWGIIASGFAAMMNSIHEAAEYTKDLDKSLTNIMMVSGETRENMNEYARVANEVAQKLGSTTVAMTDATQVFIQQGYDLQKSQQLATYSTILGNVSQQDTATASDEITAYMNAYQIPLEDIGNALSKWAEVANVSAADVEELSVASQKAASVATTVGVDMDQLAATIATIETVTREAPENIGNGLKTIYSRLSDVKLGETLEDGVDLGQITSQLDKVGVQVLDEAGKMRDVGAIMEDLMGVWETLDQTEKAATATTLAGRFQLARFEALMNRSDLYKQYLGSSRAQTGTETLDFMQQTYQESLEGRLNTLQSKFEETFLNIFESSSFYGAVDALSGLVDVLNEVIKATGGGSTALLGLSTILMSMASNSISRGVSNFITNRESARAARENINFAQEDAKRVLAAGGLNTSNERANMLALETANVRQHAPQMNDEQIRSFNEALEEQISIENQLAEAQGRRKELIEQITVLIQEENGLKEEDISEWVSSLQYYNTELSITKEQIEQIQGITQKGSGAFSELSSAIEKNGTNFNGFNNQAEQAAKLLDSLARSVAVDSEEFKLFTETENQLRAALRGETVNIEKLTQNLNKCTEGTLKFDGALQQLQTIVGKTNGTSKEFQAILQNLMDELLQATGRATGAFHAANTGLNQFKQTAHSLELQKVSKDIVGLVTGIGQLAFAWQSFKNLGSLWEDEDTSLEEKLLETIINISFMLPMLKMGFEEIKTGAASLGGAIATVMNSMSGYNAELAMNTAMEEANAASREAAKMTRLQEAATTILNSGAISEETKKQQLLIIAKQAGVVANSEMSTSEIAEAISHKTNTSSMLAESAMARRLLAAKTALLAANPLAIAAAAALAVAVGGIALAYKHAQEQYEKHREFLTESIQASDEKIQTLTSGQQNFESLYETYKQTGTGADKLKEATDSLNDSLDNQSLKLAAAKGDWETYSKELQKALVEEQKTNARKKLEDAGDLELGKKPVNNLGDKALEKAGLTADNIQFLGGEGGGTFNEGGGSSYLETILKIQAAEKEIDKELNDIAEKRKNALAAGDEDLVKELDNEKRELEAIQADYSSAYDKTEAEQYVKDLKEANQALLDVEIYNKDFDNLTSVDQVKEKMLEENEAFKALYSSMGEDEANALFTSMLTTLVQNLEDGELKDAIQQYIDEQELATEPTEENVDLVTQAVNNQNYSASTAAKKLDIDDSQFNALKEEYQQIAEIDSEGIYNSAGLKEWKNNIDQTTTSLKKQEKAIKDHIDKMEANGETVDENGKSLNAWKTDLAKTTAQLGTQDRYLKTYNKVLDDLTGKYMESAEGLQNLSDNFAKWQETLDSGSPKEQAETYTNIASALAKLMNTDASTFDATFIKDNLDLIEESANGSAEALSQLREKAAQKILVNAELADDIYNIPEYLGNVLDEAQAICDNDEIEAGASLDPSAFIAGLQAMQEQTELTAQNITAYFEALEASGVEAYIEEGSIANLVESVGATASGMLGLVGLDGSSLMQQFHETSMSLAVKLNQVRFRKIGNTGSNFSSRNAGGGSGSGGGGGGGGGGSSYEPKTKDPIEEEIDRYEKVQTALDEVDSQINKLTVDQDRLIGNNWIKNLEQETSLLQEQIPLYEEKLRIQKEEAQELQKQLATDYGAQFNDIGLLQNYAQIHKQLEKEVNDLIDEYNNETDEEGQSALEKKIEKAQERLEKFKTAYQRYDTLVSKDMIDTQKALEEIQNRLEDIRYEAYKARKQAAEELKDLRDDQREFAESLTTMFNDNTSFSLGNAFDRFKDLFAADTKYIEDAITMYKQKMSKATSQDMKNFYAAQIESLKKAQANGTSVLDLNSQRLNEVLAEYEKWLNGIATDWSEADLWEAMEEAFDDAVNLAKELKDAIDDIHDKIADVIEEMEDAVDLREKQFDNVQKQLEYVRDIAELIYGDQAYATQVQTYNLEAQNGEQRLKTLEAARKANHDILEATKNNAAMQEEYQAALEKELDYDEKILDTRKEIVDAYKQAKEAANNLAVQNWLDNFQGTIDGVAVPLKYAQEAWERINENADLYLDELNRAWETQKLQNEYLKLINDNTDPSIQKQITDQMNQQLAYLRDKTNLSKYDVEYANAQLEILQKTIALEDARANKNQMRLRRDTQGNYSYVYAASQSDIAQAENDLLDAQMNGYNISVEANRNSADSFFQKIQTMADQLRDVSNDATLSEEQIAAITAQIIQDGYEYLDAMGEQLTTAQKNMIESFIQAAQNMQIENNEAVQLIADELINNVDATVEVISDKFVSGVEKMIGPDGMALFRDEAEQTRNDIIDNVHDFENAISNANANTATPLGEIETNIDRVQVSMSSMADEAQRFYDIMNNNTGTVLKAAKELAEYQARLTDAQNELSVYSDRVNQLAKDLETQKTINTQLTTTNTELQRQLEDEKNKAKSGSGGSGSGGGGGSRNKPPDADWGVAAAIWIDGNAAGWGNGQTRFDRLEEKGVSGAQDVLNNHAWTGEIYNEWYGEDLRPYYYGAFDTGGYTGNWSEATGLDKNGKFALLHEKELVLNANDTSNMLKAVNIVREIVQGLKGASLGSLMMNGLASIGDMVLGSNVEQRVEVKAEFPNVTSSREIEDAFNTIADTSYQYAYNKNNRYQ